MKREQTDITERKINKNKFIYDFVLFRVNHRRDTCRDLIG
jgi:hypothetical protein